MKRSAAALVLLLCTAAACQRAVPPNPEAVSTAVRARIEQAKGQPGDPGGIDPAFLRRTFTFADAEPPLGAMIDGLERMMGGLEVGVAQLLQQHAKRAGTQCPNPQLHWRGDTAVIERTVVSRDGALSGGVWRDEAVVEQCGPPRNYTLLTRFGAGGTRTGSTIEAR